MVLGSGGCGKGSVDDMYITMYMKQDEPPCGPSQKSSASPSLQGCTLTFPPRVKLSDHHGSIQVTSTRGETPPVDTAVHERTCPAMVRGRRQTTRSRSWYPCAMPDRLSMRARSLALSDLSSEFDPSLTPSIYLSISATPTPHLGEFQSPCSVPPPSHKRHATPWFPTPCSTRPLRYAFLVSGFYLRPPASAPASVYRGWVLCFGYRAVGIDGELAGLAVWDAGEGGLWGWTGWWMGGGWGGEI